MRIDNETSVVGSIAGRRNRLGSLMHNAGYESLRLNFVYISFAVEDLTAAVAGMRAMHFRGFTVSMPFKQAIMPLLSRIDSVAGAIGAVNTIQNVDGGLVGFNSDWIGAMAALNEVSRPEGKRIVLLGAGGAARAIAYGLSLRSCDVTICNRTPDTAQKLARQFGFKTDSLEAVSNLDYDILINSTSVGYGTEESPLPPEALKEGRVVMDVVFDRPETPLLKLAKAKDCTVIPGYKMLLHQAVFQFELFTGCTAPVAVMEQALLGNA